jgi:hypothetical protein
VIEKSDVPLQVDDFPIVDILGNARKDIKKEAAGGSKWHWLYIAATVIIFLWRTYGSTDEVPEEVSV